MEQKLIESALGLTGKTMGDMEEIIATNIMDYHNTDIYPEFSIEKFCYYLLERIFLIKYYQNQKPGYMPSTETTDLMAGEYGYAIMEYQSGDEQPLIELLSKIK